MTNILSMTVIGVLMTHIVRGQQDHVDLVPIRKFTKTSGINCRNQTMTEQLTRISCSAKCVRLHQVGLDTCLGFRSSGSSCELCLVCSEAGRNLNPSLWSPTGGVFAVRPVHTNQDFPQKMLEGLIFHLPMESILNGETHGNGITANVIGTPGPHVVSGKHGNAIFTPNVRTNDDNIIDLGPHSSDCLGRVSNCPSGMTFSIWMKMGPQPHGWPTPMESNNFRINARDGAGKLDTDFILDDGTHAFKCRNVAITYDEWHLFGYTYTAAEGFQLYIDGCKYPLTTEIKIEQKDYNVVLGCRFNGPYCSAVNYDELRVWDEKKDEAFMWLLWRL